MSGQLSTILLIKKSVKTPKKTNRFEIYSVWTPSVPLGLFMEHLCSPSIRSLRENKSFSGSHVQRKDSGGPVIEETGALEEGFSTPLKKLLVYMFVLSPCVDV